MCCKYMQSQSTETGQNTETEGKKRDTGKQVVQERNAKDELAKYIEITRNGKLVALGWMAQA